jgi:hypothetical protein
VYGTRTVRFSRSAETAVRSTIGARFDAPNALMISTCLDAWPKPCPEM